MPEYIEREAALQEIRAYMGRFGAGEDTKELLPGLYLAEGVAERAPAADVVPVVRCKDCKYCDFGGRMFAICQKRNFLVHKEEFCNFGERRNSNAR